ncbi:hypothetical protein [Actinomycetospora atypica]|uniref:DUF732 domain-containing protein n=1 Tax=Actinomycetospora atypica TaxID=1290095 RepID=A0ABV9YQI5_9PSEU
MSIKDDVPTPGSAPKQMLVVPVRWLVTGAGVLAALGLMVWAIVALSDPNSEDRLVRLMRSDMTPSANARVTDPQLVERAEAICTRLGARSIAVAMDGVETPIPRDEFIELYDDFCDSR